MACALRTPRTLDQERGPGISLPPGGEARKPALPAAPSTPARFVDCTGTTPRSPRRSGGRSPLTRRLGPYRPRSMAGPHGPIPRTYSRCSASHLYCRTGARNKDCPTFARCPRRAHPATRPVTHPVILSGAKRSRRTCSIPMTLDRLRSIACLPRTPSRARRSSAGGSAARCRMVVILGATLRHAQGRLRGVAGPARYRGPCLTIRS
jgi:hypothetical protein